MQLPKPGISTGISSINPEEWVSTCDSQALSGRFSAVMPSDVAQKGAFAKRWLPARVRNQGRQFVPQYGSGNELKTINEYFLKCVLCLNRVLSSCLIFRQICHHVDSMAL